MSVTISTSRRGNGAIAIMFEKPAESDEGETVCAGSDKSDGDGERFVEASDKSMGWCVSGGVLENVPANSVRGSGKISAEGDTGFDGGKISVVTSEGVSDSGGDAVLGAFVGC